MKNLTPSNGSVLRKNRSRNTSRAWIPRGAILVVDDMPVNLMMVQSILKPYGFMVDCAASGREALERLRDETKKYSAVLMDHIMPDMDGIETVRIIREELGAKSEYAKTVPIIALTANAAESEALFLNRGFQAFMSKPIDAAQMDAVINRWVGRGKPGYLPEAAENLIREGEAIPGLDIRAALGRLNGDRETWLKAARSFTDSTPALLEILKDPQAGDLSKYTVTVHGIKSVCYSLGSGEAGDLAKELEKHARAGDFAFVRENTGEFIALAEKLLEGLTGLLEKCTEKTERPLLDRPDPPILAKIREAAGNYNIRSLEESIEVLEKNSYREDGDLVLWLRERCGVSDFSAVLKRLAKTEK